MPTRIRNPCSYLNRRLQVVLSLTAFVLFCILFLGSSSASEPYLNNIPYGPDLQEGAHKVVDHLPKLPADLPRVLNPFGAPAHKPPPDQPNSSSEHAKWFADFKWRSPFSSSVTYDEERVVLPPLKERPRVYTYFDSSGRRKDEKSKKAEQDLLQIWRRAWWAQGFKPVVLGRGEAMNNPLYRRVQGLKLKPEMEMEMMRWLAWGNMGTGILCNWLAVPMAHYDDALLSFLRRGEYPSLTRYKDLENGLFVGMKDDIDKALKSTLDSLNLDLALSIADAVPETTFKVDPDHDSIAFYSSSTIMAQYNAIKVKLEKEETRADGMAMLPDLVNSHLHMTWQNHFTSGIAVLKPLAQNTTSMIEPAIEIARNLSQCADSPIPASCPPNRPKCKPCVSSHPLLISTPPVFRNTSTLFTIATVPHPYTLQSLINTNSDLVPRFIRRETKRDVWILAATKELLGTGISSFARLADLKDSVASEYGQSRSLWMTAERPATVSEDRLQDLDWNFGFRVPRELVNTGKSETPVPGPERRPPPPKQEFDGPTPSEDLLAKQKQLVEDSRKVLAGVDKNGKKKPDAISREVMEAWNLADTEVWKFVRAFGARRTMEREKWEEEEEKFLGKGTYERWKDYVGGKE